MPTFMTSQSIEIDITSETIGTGGTRLCFPYPGDPNKCIKVCRPIHMLTKRTLRRIIRAWIANKIPALNTNWHEYRFWEKHIHDTPVPGLESFFPQFYGTMKTSAGPGIVVECVRDANGAISQCLETWLPNAPRKDQQTVIQQLKTLTDLFIDYKLPCYDWGANNFLVQQTADGFQLKLIDCEGDLGNREFIPIRTIFPPLRRLKLKRRIQRGLLSWLDQFET
jgi:hypothetical protein